MQILDYPEKHFRETNTLAYFYHTENDSVYKVDTYSALPPYFVYSLAYFATVNGTEAVFLVVCDLAINEL